jgi:diadenosine tetraphosphate (Ap4A) HIT family hydrolase
MSKRRGHDFKVNKDVAQDAKVLDDKLLVEVVSAFSQLDKQDMQELLAFLKEAKRQKEEKKRPQEVAV